MKKIFLKIILGSIILEALLICFFILLGDFDKVSWESLTSVAIILECSIPCLFYSKIYDNPKYKNIAMLGIAISGIVAVISILSLWTKFENDIITKILISLQNIMWVLVFISQLLSYNSTEKIVNYFKKISISTLIVFNMFILAIIWTEESPKGFFARLYYMVIVLTVASYIATLIIVRIYKKSINTNLNNENNNLQEPDENPKTEDIKEE